VQAAQAVRLAAQQTLAARAGTEVGEVRSTTNKSTQDAPSQTELVWRGLADLDGERNQARRLAVTRPSPAPASDTPYATPFAWGKCGLVLPRYPGTRVVVAHRDGRPDDPIDLGALWESGHGPDSEPGDWWLILPVKVEKPQSLGESEVPQEHKAEVTTDLIDGDGNRVLEVGSLTVRVGTKSLQKASGLERPKPGSDVVTIATKENAEASITIDKDGTITLTAGKDLVLKATNGDIKLDTKSVDVKVSSEMNVH
jgi:hypothetical protein